MPGDKGNGDERDLLAFAEAIGNYADVTAQTGEETLPGPSGPIFDFDSPQSNDLIDTATGEHPASPVHPQRECATGEALVPLIGMRLAVGEVDLGEVRLVRAGALADPPAEAVGSDDNVFAVIRSGPSPQAPAAATESLKGAITTLRMLKPGGVGLGSHGWVRDESGWRRFSTGAARPRPGGYELTAGEADALVELAGRIDHRGARTPAFAWALSRFDLGAERTNQVEALSDYLLAMRALIEGGGPAKAGFVARAAALCAGEKERPGVQAAVELALALERKLMNGDRVKPGDGSPLAAIATIEEMLRTLLRGMATGELGSDLRITADEILLADGLKVGEGSALQLGGTAEWRVADNEETAEWRIPDLDEAERIVAEHGELSSPLHDVPAEGISPPAPELGITMGDNNDDPLLPKPEPEPERQAWLAKETEESLDWPSFASPRPKGDREKRRAKASERVQFLFPEPDETDWSLGEMGEKRRRRSG